MAMTTAPLLRPGGAAAMQIRCRPAGQAARGAPTGRLTGCGAVPRRIGFGGAARRCALRHGPHTPHAAAPGGGSVPAPSLRTCRRCKQRFDPDENSPHSCKFHPAHYGGETARKFESAYTGGTMTTSGGGKVVSYWHCCGETDPEHPGCESAPHVGFGDD